MAAHFTKEEIQEIIRLKDEEGLTHRQIAEKLNRLDGDGVPNERSIMIQYTKYKKEQEANGGPASIVEEPHQKDLNELTRKQRVDYLKDKLPKSARGQHIFNNVLSTQEQELFLEEFFNVIREEDSLTSAEEQQLFNATLHLVLAWRAAAQDRECYNRSPNSGYTGPNPTVYIDIFKRDFQDNMKKYNEFMKSLKLSREQRLENIKRQGTSFLDFAEKYAKNDSQAKAADDILKLEYASEAELKRLQENGWLCAGGLPNNNPINYGPPKEKKDA